VEHLAHHAQLELAHDAIEQGAYHGGILQPRGRAARGIHQPFHTDDRSPHRYIDLTSS
jgi:hypothetical protein